MEGSRRARGAKQGRVIYSPRKRRSKRLNLSASLQELEGEYWGEPGLDTYVVTTCHRMRQKPLKDVTVEELQLVIGQGLSLEWLIPVALPILAETPLVEGAHWAGDLLASVLRVPEAFWQEHPDWHAQADAIARKAIAMCEGDDSRELPLKWLREAYGHFRGQK